MAVTFAELAIDRFDLPHDDAFQRGRDRREVTPLEAVCHLDHRADRTLWTDLTLQRSDFILVW